jgi:hypothetical protein
MKYCQDCEELLMELEYTRKQLKEAREIAARATDLMMKGEALREKMMLQAILSDGFQKNKSS